MSAQLNKKNGNFLLVGASCLCVFNAALHICCRLHAVSELSRRAVIFANFSSSTLSSPDFSFGGLSDLPDCTLLTNSHFAKNEVKDELMWSLIQEVDALRIEN